ncbi:hypothetical protein Hanom_Chr15g01404341 [Helianthus anomalus]
MDELRRENEGLKADLKTSQTVAAELRCRVTDAERKLLEEKELDSVSQGDLDTMYAEWRIVVDENQKLAKERAYRDMGYQSGLKDGYAYSAKGLGRKETPLYNSKAKKQLFKLDK